MRAFKSNSVYCFSRIMSSTDATVFLYESTDSVFDDLDLLVLRHKDHSLAAGWPFVFDTYYVCFYTSIVQMSLDHGRGQIEKKSCNYHWITSFADIKSVLYGTCNRYFWDS